ncbi:MAG: patatin-like phospholipase family protein [Steroidobacterales bacterium]
MALEDERSVTAYELRGALACLTQCAALTGVDSATLATLALEAVHFCLPAGDFLFESGTEPDGIYLVTSGRLGVQDPARPTWTACIGAGEFVGEMSWLLGERHSASVVALRDCELLWLTAQVMQEVAQQSPSLSLAIARLCARRLHHSNRNQRPSQRARVFVVVPNSVNTDSVSFATQLVVELGRHGRAEMVWDVRAFSHTTHWFNDVEEKADFVVYLADSLSSAWTRQCCRQADFLLLTGNAEEAPASWPSVINQTCARPGVRTELALLHSGSLCHGAAARWLAATPARRHHHIVGTADVARLARLLAQKGVGLVLSGGGARGFAHLGVIQALREARVPIDCVGGSSIGSIIAAGLAMGWGDAEMRERYFRTFVATNPLSDYTFPLVALTRGRKVARLLQQEFGEVGIEDLPVPFFCVSANLSTGRACEHRSGLLWHTLRASVAIPGIMPPVFRDEEVLVDGAAVNNLPVDIMQDFTPGFVIGSDAGAVSSLRSRGVASGQPPFWRLFRRTRTGKPRINIFQILMESNMVGSASSAAAQREFADLILKPPLLDIELLDWRAFQRVIDIGYRYTLAALENLPAVPRLADTPPRPYGGASSLKAAIARHTLVIAELAGPDALPLP